MEQEILGLNVEEFAGITKDDNVIVLDTRVADAFTSSFVPGSLFLGLEGKFTQWAKELIHPDKKIVLVADPEKEAIAASKLNRAGFKNIAGYLSGGFSAWANADKRVDMIIDVEADELIMDYLHDENLVAVDVRNEVEYGDGHLEDAVNLPLDEMTDIAQMAQFEENQNLYVYGGGGYRSVIACSLMKKHGYHNLRNVIGGWDAIKVQERAKIVKEAKTLN